MIYYSVPENYKSILTLKETQIAIKKIKDFFERQLAVELNLTRVSAPIFVPSESGLNDNLNGHERPVTFDAACGEDLDNIHSMFVDQWDWERIIDKCERNEIVLKKTVKAIYRALRHTEIYISGEYPFVERALPEEITFVTTQELEDMYPDLSPKEREYLICKDKKAVFLSQIGGKLKSGSKHDGRAPDYDDWMLNGDILVYYPVLDIALELSSMGIRVDEEAMKRQLEISGCNNRAELPFHKSLLNGELPYTIGGGIGQSRMCMFFLRKAHIGEVQSSFWSDEDRKECREKGISLL